MTWPTTSQTPHQAACPAGPTRSGSAYLRPSRVIQLALERPHLWRVRSATCRDAAQRRMDSAGVADARGPSHRDLESVCGPRPRLGGLLGVMSEFGGPPQTLVAPTFYWPAAPEPRWLPSCSSRDHRIEPAILQLSTSSQDLSIDDRLGILCPPARCPCRDQVPSAGCWHRDRRVRCRRRRQGPFGVRPALCYQGDS